MRLLYSFICSLLILGLFSLMVLADNKAAANYEMPPTFRTDFNATFDAAYAAHPRVPNGVLEGIAYTQSRVRAIAPEQEAPSCIGLPYYYGVMGLVADGKDYFRSNMRMVADLTGASIEDLKYDSESQIMAYAEAFETLIYDHEIPEGAAFEAYIPIIAELSELPSPKNLANDFAMSSHIYAVCTIMQSPYFVEAYGTDGQFINLKEYFGEQNYNILSASKIYNQGDQISNDKGEAYEEMNYRMGGPCYEYSGVIWSEADPSNYSSRAGTAITHVTIHTMQGSYAGAISWFQNPSANVSAHYNMRAMDGQITQMVCEADKAWHVSNSNPYTVGIEHEGYVDDATWYTDITYTTSADLTIDIANEYNIPILETYDALGANGVDPISDGCFSVKGHQHYPNQTHTDPGPNWDWFYFYDLINPPPAPNTYTSCSGNLMDSSGGSNLPNNHRSTYLINPSGASSVTLSFNSMDLETNYDYLYIYDGDSHHDELITVLNGNSPPAPITANSGSMYLEVRTDCGTTSPGWDADWSCSTSSPSCGVPTNLYITTLEPFNARLNWDAVSGATNYEVQVKWSVDAAWTTYYTTDNYLDVNGLASSYTYLWQVRASCGGSNSTFAGDQFVTPEILIPNYIPNQCSGVFNDSGGAIGHYYNNEDYVFTIAPPLANSVTVTFTSFEIENNYDYLYIYDGSNTSAPLLGTYTGTNSPGTITSTGGTLSFRFVADNWTTKPGWEASWVCDAPPTCSPSMSIDPIGGTWQTTDFLVDFSDIDDCGSGIETRYYLVNHLDANEWRSNTNNGFFNDDFDNGSIHSDWTNVSGNWTIASNTINQSNESINNTNIYAPLDQDDSFSYLYHWQAEMSGSGSNRRSGIHFFCDDPTATNRGNSYFVYFRADNDKVQIYKVVADTWTLESDDTWTIDPNIVYDYKITFNPTSGKISAYVDDQLASTWTDSSPHTSGTHISLRTGNVNTSYDFIRSYKSRATSVNVTIGPVANDDVQFQSPNPSTDACEIYATFVDVGGKWANTPNTYAKIDWTAPSSVTVNDGPGADIDTDTDLTQLSANWSNASDPHSNVITYWYAFGTSPGATDIVGWTNNGTSTSATATGLSLTNGQTYYVSVKSDNGAGLTSIAYSSDGVTINSGPVALKVKALMEGPYNSGGNMHTTLSTQGILPLNQPFNAPPWNYSGSESVSSIPADVVDWVFLEILDNSYNVVDERAAFIKNNGTIVDTDATTTIDFNTIIPGNYYVVVKARNHVGLMSDNSISLPNTNSLDLRVITNVRNGSTQLYTTNDGNYCMHAGDYNGDGIMTISDFNAYVTNPSEIMNYHLVDVNMDGYTTVQDYNLYRKNMSFIGINEVRYP